MKILHTRNLTYSEVSKILDDIRGRGYELDQLALRVNEYVKKFSKCNDWENLLKDLSEMGLKEITAVMIANIVPKNEDEVKALLNFEAEDLPHEKIEEILQKVSQHC
ncbi:MAG: hypothetical protein J7L55_02910 [Desulfurococcales archaeon]|nr:hypothetical protein [Desulfurococcales archaeon]